MIRMTIRDMWRVEIDESGATVADMLASAKDHLDSMEGMTADMDEDGIVFGAC